MNKPTSEDIQAYRDKHECGGYEARARLMKAYVKGELMEIKMSRDPPAAKINSLIDLVLYAMEQER